MRFGLRGHQINQIARGEGGARSDTSVHIRFPILYLCEGTYRKEEPFA